MFKSKTQQEGNSHRQPGRAVPFVLLLLALFIMGHMTGCRPVQNPTQETPEVLVLAQEGPILSMDPQAYNDSVTWSFQSNVYDPLVSFDGEMKITSVLAERWENPNDLTWRFYLRKNVRFHNGKPFTADDVVYTIRRGLLPASTGTRPYLISVTSANKIDDWTVDIVTDRPNPVLLNKLTFLLIIPSGQSMETSIDKPVGTGPYRFLNKIGTHKVSVQANDNYYRGKPPIERVDFVTFDDPDNDGVEALLQGKIHILRDFAEPLIPKVQQSTIAELQTHDALGVTFLGFNVTGTPATNPLANLDLRRALYCAIDNNALVKNTLGGRGTVANQLVSPNVFGFDPDYKPMRPGIETARELLKKAGHPDGFSTEIYGNDDIRIKKLAEQLQMSGIHADPRLIAWKDLYDRMIAHQLPLFTLSWACSYGDAGDFLENCVHSLDPKTGYGSYNVAGYVNPEVDRLIEQSGQTLKVSERKEQLQRALSIVMTDLPYVPLFSRYRHYGVSKLIEWTPRKDGRLYAFDIRWKEKQ